jgi:histidyl-tRNA synthetase
MDILGIAHVMADAELIAASIDIMRDLGLTSTDFTVHVSSRNLLEELFLGAGLQKESLPLLYALLDRRHKMPPGEFMEQLTQTVPLQSVRDTINAILQMKSFDEIRAINSNAQSVKELSSLFELMDAYGMKEYVAFDIGIVRGLAYYTGIVFELLDKNRDLRAIAGGGRYDKLVSLYGGPDTPAAGFAIGDVVLAELLTAKGVIPDYTVPRSTVFIVSLCQDTAAGSIALAQLLRSNGISCEFALKPQNISKQMKGADAARSQIVIFTGGDEEKQGMVKIKIMRTGEEKLVFKDTIVQNVKECIAI